MTSDQNSYGLVKGKWFDGKVFGEYGRPWALLLDQHVSLEIYSVTEYRKLKYTCSNDSYYECLSRRFQDAYFSSHFNHTFDGINCSQAICLPFSLPEIGDSKIPPCQKLSTLAYSISINKFVNTTPIAKDHTLS